jgi:hypothetical protein
LDFVGVVLADFSTFGDAVDFSVVVGRTLEVEPRPDENMPRPKSNLAIFGALDDALEPKVDVLLGPASSCNCLSAFCAMCVTPGFKELN